MVEYGDATRTAVALGSTFKRATGGLSGHKRERVADRAAWYMFADGVALVGARATCFRSGDYRPTGSPQHVGLYWT